MRHKYPDEKPPVQQDAGGSTRSIDVLATDGTRWWLAWLLIPGDDRHPPQWIEAGRDEYKLTALIDGWEELPSL